MEKNYGVNIKWLAVSCFEIRCGETTVVTDPFVTECEGTDLNWEAVENCDIICLGHAHWDHITDIPRLADKFHPLIICGEQTAMPLAMWLNYTPTRIYPMCPNLELNFNTVKIRALFGRHKDFGRGLNDMMHKSKTTNQICMADSGIASLQGVGSMEYRNYLLTLKNETKILVWGSEPTEDQIHICKPLQPDIAIIQRSANPKSIVAKAEFAAAIGCKVLIPHHHDFHGVDTPESIDAFEREFLKRVPDGTFIRPKHGEWIAI